MFLSKVWFWILKTASASSCCSCVEPPHGGALHQTNTSQAKTAQVTPRQTLSPCSALLKVKDVIYTVSMFTFSLISSKKKPLSHFQCKLFLRVYSSTQRYTNKEMYALQIIKVWIQAKKKRSISLESLTTHLTWLQHHPSLPIFLQFAFLSHLC